MSAAAMNIIILAVVLVGIAIAAISLIIHGALGVMRETDQIQKEDG